MYFNKKHNYSHYGKFMPKNNFLNSFPFRCICNVFSVYTFLKLIAALMHCIHQPGI